MSATVRHDRVGAGSGWLEGAVDDALLSIVLERVEHAGLDQDVELQVLAACEGLLGDLLDDGEYEPPTAETVADAEPPGVYLGDLTVEGFRGIGARRTLPLTPGPGLTLVVGRNGSGKSSFAEAAEMLLTGANRRWQDRPRHWHDGWRNLHRSDACEITAELSIDGEPGPVHLLRQWATDEALEDAHTIVRSPHHTDRPIEALGWDQALVAYRPFLSYNELGSMLEGKPSELHDAMSSILGLDDLDKAVKALGDAKRVRARRKRDAKDALQPLLTTLAEHDDERAARCHTALSGRAWDLDAVDEVLLADEIDTEAAGVLTTLRGLASLDCPSDEQVEKATSELLGAQAAVDDLAGSDADKADALARVLSAALHAHEAHGDQDCPVCGAGRLDAAWHAAATDEVMRLRREASAARQAHTRLEHAITAARMLAGDPPAVLIEGEQAGVETLAAVTAWRRVQALPDGAVDIADHLERTHQPLRDAVAAVRSAASAELDRRNAEWVPLARELSQWAAEARHAVAADEQATRLKVGERWLKDTVLELRAERFRPIADQARDLWEQLRQQSSVQLDDVMLAGSATQRRLELSVSVDGSDSSALGVMSQGELHALALSLFLPRATLPESPFRFLVIDDPVQSMDPARVDGLAKVLDLVARDRQVIVFTHDDRLPESVRRLGIDARVIGVTRRTQSRVEVGEQLEPVARNIDDARALVNSRDVPDDLVARVVPGLCRTAIEAASVEAIRRRWLASSVPHAEVEQRLADIMATVPLVATALFDDAGRGGEVYARVNRWGRDLGDALRWSKEGAHEVAHTDRRLLLTSIDRSEQLATHLKALT